MKKNEELKHNTSKKKLTKKNYIIIIAPIVLSIILILTIAYYVFVYSSSSNKLKRTLLENEYSCNKQVCTKEQNNTHYSIDYKNIIFSVDTNNYHMTVNTNTTPSLEIKSKEYVCTFTKIDYSSLQHIDNTFLYDRQCENYIEEINKRTDEFKSLLDESKIDVNKIDK